MLLFKAIMRIKKADPKARFFLMIWYENYFALNL